MLEGFTPVPIQDIRGVYFRGQFPENIPPGYAFAGLNMMYDNGGGLMKRWAVASHLTLNVAVGTPYRMHIYNKASGPRILLIDEAGELFDISGAAPGTAILSFPNLTDFSVITMFDRAYITPHDRSTGLSSEKVYVYDGTTARAAAGAKPSTTLSAATGAAGNVVIGVHIISFAFETDTGFITKYATPIAYTAPGGAKIDLTSVDTGPSGTVKRHILVSKAIPNYNGNVNDYELFFVDTINDNTATTKTIDFFDGSLVSSAKYLLDQLETIPAGVFLCEHEGRLVVGGEAGATLPITGGSNPIGSSVARVSKSGNSESFNAVSGWVMVSPDGGGLKNGRSFKGNLYLFKSQRTHVTWDTGGEPSTWPVQLVDAGQGTECFGIAELDTSKGFTQEAILVLNKGGLWPFNGSYADRPLTWNISRALYNHITTTSYVDSNSEVMISARYKIIFINLRTIGATTPDDELNVVWAGFYEEGLSWEAIKWIPWQFNVVDVSTPQLASIKIIDDVLYWITGGSNQVFKVNVSTGDDEGSIAIEHYIDLPVPTPFDGGVYKCNGAMIVATSETSETTVDVIYMNVKRTVISTVQIVITDRGNRTQYNFAPVDLESELMFVKVKLNTSGKGLYIYRIIPYVKKVWSIRPL